MELNEHIAEWASGPETLPDTTADPDAGHAEGENEELSPGEGWAVILYNDDHNDMLHVVAMIVKATGFAVERAVEIMMTAHTKGKALVTITEKAQAERIASMLKTGGLTVELQMVN